MFKLIETLWNVNNDTATNVEKPTTQINRNIVECKYADDTAVSTVQTEINRNIVECKCRKSFFLSHAY